MKTKRSLVRPSRNPLLKRALCCRAGVFCLFGIMVLAMSAGQAKAAGLFGRCGAPCVAAPVCPSFCTGQTILMPQIVFETDVVGKITFGNVWALLVDGKFGPGLPPAEPFPIPVHTGDVRVDVQAALEKLSPKLREVLVLAVHQGLAYEDIAAVLRIPVGTVKSRVFNALSVLKETFHEDPS